MEDIYIHNHDNPLTHTPHHLIETTIETVENLLKERYPDYIPYNNGSFTVSHGSAIMMIIVRPFTDNETCVECISPVVTGAVVDFELMHFLMRKNAELHYGSFGLLFDDTITFAYSITGTTLDQSELVNAISAVGTISDYYDDIIVEMAGGKRGVDLSVYEE